MPRRRYPANPAAAAEFYSRADLQSLLEALAIPLQRVPSQSGFAQGAQMMLEMLAAAVGVQAPDVGQQRAISRRSAPRLYAYEEPEELADGEWTVFS